MTAPTPAAVSEADTDADFAQIKALFDAVCDLGDPAKQRDRLAASGASAAILARVQTLLDNDRAHTTRFGRPVAGMLASAAAPELAPGDRLGHWTLLHELGHGGMGQVFLAERSDGHYQQHAAIKLLRGWTSAEALAQLARERQILASLQHPNIARLIDGGSTPRGRPYLVMDYVEGRPIDAYCREQGLGVDATLLLFEGVCDAVAYAHRQLIVHCDIKPGNVLVAADGRAMLLDFGIAQLQGREGNQTVSLTPRYASPEQLAGQPATAACDIYSLGRLLDELLQALGPAAPRAWEWQAIIAKATASEADRRYLTVPALVSDLRRYRQHQPLAALPRRWPYRTRKLLRRRWPWALAGAGVLCLSLLFVLRLVQERDRALLAEGLARQEAATTREVSDFMVALFEGADPNVAGHPDLSAASLVDKGRERIDTHLRDQPALQAAMKAVLGNVYDNIGRPRTAVELYQEAARLEHELQRPLREAAVLGRLAYALGNSSQVSASLAPAQAALALREQARPPADALELAEAHNTLGWALSRNSRFDEAEGHLREALRIRSARLGEDHLDVAITLHNLGLLQHNRGQLEAAEASLRRALAIKGRLLDARHPSMLNSQQSLAITLAAQHRSDEALALLSRLVEQRRAVHGENSVRVAGALNELASVLQDAGRSAEAIASYRLALELYERLNGRRSADVAVATNNLATALEDVGDPAAEAHYRTSLALRQALQPEGDLSVARARHNLGRWLFRAGRQTEARPLLEQAAATRGAQLPAEHKESIDTQLALAELELASGRLPAADEALARAARHEPVLRAMRQVALWRVQGLLLGAHHQALEALQMHQQALQLAMTTVGPAHPALTRLRLDLAQAQLAMGQAEAARASLQAAQPALAGQPPRSPLNLTAASLRRQLPPMLAASAGTLEKP